MCDCPEWVVAFLGAIGLGAIAAPISTMLSAAEVRSILNDFSYHDFSYHCLPRSVHCGRRPTSITA